MSYAICSVTDLRINFIVYLLIIDIEETLELFMDIQILGDRTLRKLAFSHVVDNIQRMNQKHKNEAKNRKLQNILFLMLQGEEEQRAKRSLVILCDLHRRRVWFDDRTANAICTACFHSSSRIMISALSFLLGYEQIEEEDDSEASSSEDDTTSQQPITLSREAIYKANHKGTAASKKKKKAKLQRAIRNMKRQQRITSQSNSSSYYSPLTHLKDAQGFAEKLFSRLQRCNERFEVVILFLMHAIIIFEIFTLISCLLIYIASLVVAFSIEIINVLENWPEYLNLHVTKIGMYYKELYVALCSIQNVLNG
uniref:Protein SDA1 n=1 Tax=Musa acuminata subsp. malaccensis TaxID=214687 RepID=A0A804HTC1_MUSAM